MSKSMSCIYPEVGTYFVLNNLLSLAKLGYKSRLSYTVRALYSQKFKLDKISFYYNKMMLLDGAKKKREKAAIYKTCKTHPSGIRVTAGI